MSRSLSIEEILGKSRDVMIKRGRTVVDINLPDGSTIGLTAHQAINAKIEPHGNHGRSRISFTLEVEVEACGFVEANQRAISIGLLREIERVRKDLSAANGKLRELKDAATLGDRLAEAKGLLAEWLEGPMSDKAADEKLGKRTRKLLGVKS